MLVVEAEAAVKGLLKGLGEAKAAVQGSAVQIGSFKGTGITMAGHIPGGESCSSQGSAWDQSTSQTSKTLEGRAGLGGGWWQKELENEGGFPLT